MDFIHTLLSYISPAHIISSLGLIGVIAVVFAESGLFFGFFLPGDSLLFTAGFLASQGILSLPLLFVGTFAAAVVGDSVGYAFGKKVGQPLYSRPDSRFFKKKHVEKAREFYDKHGSKAIVLARFIPIVRTFVPIVAGVVGMNYRRFLSYNIVGGLIWAVGLSGFGYFFGNLVPNAEKYVTGIVFAIIFISILPTAYHILKSWITNRKQNPEM